MTEIREYLSTPCKRAYYEVTSPKINLALDLLLDVMAEQLNMSAV